MQPRPITRLQVGKPRVRTQQVDKTESTSIEIRPVARASNTTDRKKII